MRYTARPRPRRPPERQKRVRESSSTLNESSLGDPGVLAVFSLGAQAAMNDRPLVSYHPNPVLARIYRLLFEHIEVDDAWLRAVRDAKARGTVVYVLRNLSFVDFLALDHLTKRYDLPEIRFANDLGLWVLEPMGNGWLNALRPRTATGDAANLERAVAGGASAALFLKRPPSLLEARARGKIEGDHLIRALFDLQRRSDARVLLVPQVFVWSRSAGTRGGNVADAVFGP